MEKRDHIGDGVYIESGRHGNEVFVTHDETKIVFTIPMLRRLSELAEQWANEGEHREILNQLAIRGGGAKAQQ